MAYLEINKKLLEHNFKFLNQKFAENDIEWAIVTKLLCGEKDLLKLVLDLGINEFCDSRISNLKTIKEINQKVETFYIKPPAKNIIPEVVKYADASFNTEYETIKWISKESKKQNKIHKVVIMIELGDLREGIMGENLLDFYEKVFKLPNIQVSGIGTNLNCLSGVYPSEDKLVQLSLYKQLIEAKFNQKIKWVTGGTSVAIPLLFRNQVPKGINHFRVGETLFFGNDLVSGKPIEGMKDDVFELYSQIIEIHEKPVVPIGYVGENPSGESAVIDEKDYGKKTYRAIIDIGVLDISKTDFLIPKNKNIELVGASSDMLVVDLGDEEENFKVGDYVEFKIDYMGALRIFNSDYIKKKII